MRTSVARRPREDDISHSRKKLVNSDGIESDTSFSYNSKHRDAFWFSSRVLVFFSFYGIWLVVLEVRERVITRAACFQVDQLRGC